MSSTPSFPELNIGKAAEEEFFRPPRLPSLFEVRARRLRSFGADHPLKAFLDFIAALAELQARLTQDIGAPSPAMVTPESMAAAHDHQMPLLDLSSWRPTAFYLSAIRRIVKELPLGDLPEESRNTVARLAEASDDQLGALGIAVVTRTVSAAAAGEAVFAVAALQAELALHAARLEPRNVKPLDAKGLCPACGSPPLAGIVVADQAYGRRFLTCSLCCSAWNHVRVNCIVCGDEKKIAYLQIEGADSAAKAETCDACGCYSKLLYAEKDNDVEALADDLASFGLDILVSETGWKRHAPNPFLQGH